MGQGRAHPRLEFSGEGHCPINRIRRKRDSFRPTHKSDLFHHGAVERSRLGLGEDLADAESGERGHTALRTDEHELFPQINLDFGRQLGQDSGAL